MRSKTALPVKNPVRNVNSTDLSSLTHPPSAGERGDDNPFEPLTCASAFLNQLAPGTLAIAVSGGSDSLGVLHLLNAQNQNRRKLICFTVDHQLRPEAQQEAAYVHEICLQLGIEHHILHWQGEKPESGLQNAARQARYRLLADACKAFGAIGLVTGHTLDDQLETIAMRQKRIPQHGPAMFRGQGLSGMAFATLFFQDMWVLRPFLRVQRAHIRKFLTANKVSWIEDPSNEDLQYERVQMRRSGPLPVTIADVIRHQKSRSERSEAAASYLDRHCTFVDGLVAKLVLCDDARRAQDTQMGQDARGNLNQPIDLNRSEDPNIDGDDDARLAIQLNCMVALIDVIGGRARNLTSYQMNLLRSFLKSGSARMTIGRTLLELKHHIVTIRREARGIQTVELPPRTKTLWDGRYWIKNLHPSEQVYVTYQATSDGHAPFIRIGPSGRLLSLNEIDMEEVFVQRAVNKYDEVLSSFDWALANRLAMFLRHQPYKQPPLSLAELGY